MRTVGKSSLYILHTFGKSVVRFYNLLTFIVEYNISRNFLFLCCHATYLLSSNFISSINVISIPFKFLRLILRMLGILECANHVGVITLYGGCHTSNSSLPLLLHSTSSLIFFLQECYEQECVKLFDTDRPKNNMSTLVSCSVSLSIFTRKKK